MNITVNGNSKSLHDIFTVTDLLENLELSPDTVVVELNTTIIQPDSYSSVKITENDQVEIIRFVGGG